MKMTPEKNRQVEPLCKFGPGGDFVITWQPEPSDAFEMSSRLVRLLSSAVEVVAVIFGFKLAAPGVSLRNNFCCDELIVFDREKVINAAENTKLSDTAYAPATTVADNGGAFSAEPTLFPDLGGDGVRVKHKPKHRIRTYRRVAKKGSALRFAQQGSLFESQFQSAKTA